MPPKHYTEGTYEPLKVIQAWELNFSLGNVVKYIARAGRKGPALDDLVKARDYLDREIDRLANEMLAKDEISPFHFPKCPWWGGPGTCTCSEELDARVGTPCR